MSLVIQCSCDWLQFTVKSMPEISGNGKTTINHRIKPEWQTVARSILLMNPTNFQQEPRGMMGYLKKVVCDGIIILFDGSETMGVHVILSSTALSSWCARTGQSVDYLIKSLESEDINVSRLDLATDERSGLFTMKYLLTASKDDIRFMTKWKRKKDKKTGELRKPIYYKMSFDEDTGKEYGGTLECGERGGNAFLRIYDKGLQLGNNEPWIRFEMELRNDNAQNALKLLQSGMDIGQVSHGVLSNYLKILHRSDVNAGIRKDRCRLDPKWAKFTKGIEKVKVGTTHKKESMTVEKALRQVTRNKKALAILADCEGGWERISEISSQYELADSERQSVEDFNRLANEELQRIAKLYDGKFRNITVDESKLPF